jgi:hypothetical protein
VIRDEALIHEIMAVSYLLGFKENFIRILPSKKIKPYEKDKFHNQNKNFELSTRL